MAVSKVILNGTTLIDVTQDTVDTVNLLSGETATKNSGVKVTGAYVPPTFSTQSKTVSPSTSQRTVSPDTGYDGLSSVTVNAISPTKAAATYTPTTTDQSIASGQWLTGAQTILGDANLLPENIAEGVTIFGVTGTHSGGGSVNVLTLYVEISTAMQGTLYIDSGLRTPFNVENFDYDYRAAYEYVASFDFIKIIGIHTRATNDRSYMIVDCVFLDPIDDTLLITASYKGTRNSWYL